MRHLFHRNSSRVDFSSSVQIFRQKCYRCFLISSSFFFVRCFFIIYNRINHFGRELLLVKDEKYYGQFEINEEGFLWYCETKRNDNWAFINELTSLINSNVILKSC